MKIGKQSFSKTRLFLLNRIAIVNSSKSHILLDTKLNCISTFSKRRRKNKFKQKWGV